MHFALVAAIAALPLAFFAGAFAFRRNPLLGARTLDQLDGWYHQAKARLVNRQEAPRK